jgi:DUF1680 family protein
MPSGPVAPTATAACRLHPLPLRAARITGGPWAARQRANRAVAIASGPSGPDTYAWIEAVAWEYARQPAPDLLRAQRAATAEVARCPDARRAGRLIQAAIAQVRATGDRTLLQVAVRVADRLDGGAETDPVLPMALVELFRETDNRRHLELARRLGPAPPEEDAVYRAAGAADVAVECDDRDLLDALARRFAGLPPPPAGAYPVTGGLQWAWRMLLATGEACYADAAERMLRHVDADPAADRMRTLTSLDSYLATTDADGVQLHLYAPSVVTARLADGPIRLTVATGGDRVRVRVDESPRREWTLSTRVAGTYAEVVRVWRPGDAVEVPPRG